MPRSKKKYDVFDDVEDNDVKDGAWKVFNHKNGNSYTNTRSATTRKAMQQSGTSAVFQVLGDGAVSGQSSVAASSSMTASRLVSSTAMHKLEEAVLDSRVVLAVDTTRASAALEEGSVPAGAAGSKKASSSLTTTAFEQVGLVESIVDVLVGRIAANLFPTSSNDDDDDASTSASPLSPRLIDVTYLLLGVGELDNAPSCLQMALGMAVARRLHGRRVHHEVEDGIDRTAVKSRQSMICLRSIVTYDPMITLSSTALLAAASANKSDAAATDSSAVPTANADPSSAAVATKGLEGYIRRWNNVLVSSTPTTTSSSASNGDGEAIPPLPPITYDDTNRFGAYAVGGGPSADGKKCNDEGFLVAFTPHCPRALYHNLLVANIGSNGAAVSGGGEGAAPSPAAASSSLSSSSPLSRLIIMGNDITGYTRHDKRCVLEGIVNACEDASPSANLIARSDLRALVLSTKTSGKPFVPQSNSSKRNGGCIMHVTGVEKMLQEASSKAAAEAKVNELERNLPKAMRPSASSAAADSSAPLATRSVRYMTVPTKGKYGSHTTAEAERAFGDMCVVSFTHDSAAFVGEKLLPSQRRIITSGEDLL